MSIGFLLLVVTALVGCSRQGEKSVAVVGGKKIRADEFRERYKSFLEATGVRDNIVQRKAVLQNMINEVLIMEQLRSEGFFDRPDVKKRLKEIQLQALLDRYAVKYIADTVQVSEKELREEFRDAHAKVKARYLYAKTEQEAWELKRKIEQGASFENLARFVFDDPGLANNGGNLGYFSRGEMDERLEEVAFSLPPGKVSDPVKIGIGYAVIKVEDRVDHPLLSEYDYAREKKGIEERVRKRKAVAAIETTARRIAEDLSPRFNDRALQMIFEHWNDIATQASPPELSARPSTVIDPKMHLVDFSDESWSIADFVEKLAFTSAKQRARVKTLEDLRNVVTGLAAREILLVRAKETGCENDQETRVQVERVTLQYTLKRWSSAIEQEAKGKPILEDTLRKVYEQQQKEFIAPPEVNVAEILVRTREEAEAIRRRIDRGEDFHRLARTLSLRTWAAERGGELGYGTVQTFGILGEKFMKAPIGSFIGPEFVDPYYGVFKILGKKPPRQKSFEECREIIAGGLLREREMELRRKALARMRTLASITIDEAVLANIQM